MTETERKEALEQIKKLEEANNKLVQNNRKMDEELNELEAIYDKDEATINKIKSLQEKIEANNETIERQNAAIENLKQLLKSAVEKEIEKFNTSSVIIGNHLQMIKVALTLETSVEETNITTTLTSLTEELKDFEDKSMKLAAEIKEFSETTKRDDFNLTPKDIRAKVKYFKIKLRDLKKEQIEKYNVRIEYINSVIKEYKETIKENSEAYALVSQLEFLSVCTATVSEWRHISYLSQLDYKKIVEVTKLIKLIEEKKLTMVFFDSLEAKLNFINERLVKLDVEVIEEMEYATIVYAKGMLEKVSGLLLSFGQKLEQNKKEMTDEDYRKYSDRYRELMQTYFAIRKRLLDIEKKVNKEEVMNYDNLSNELNGIENEVNDFEFLLDSLYGNVLASSSTALNTKYTVLENKLLMFENALEKEYSKLPEECLLDENQYNNLKNRINAVKEKLENTNSKLKDPKMFSIEKTNDIYDFLNGTIEGIEKTLDGLEITLNRLDKPIKDKETRKHLDAIFKKLESEIKRLEKQLAMYKNQDEDKYNDTKERLNNAKKRMNTLSKNYRRKCPLLVRAVKSAKHFFKKYKKVLLIIAGLVAFAMIAHSVIIPAIMHGNIMVSYFSPALRGPIKTINNLLGGLIGATKSPLGVWSLANGTILNSSTATASLLKGLAISGIGSAALVAPVIVAVKKLIEKINMAELKQRLIDGKDFVVNGVKTGVATVERKTTEFVEKTKDNSSKTKAKKELMKDTKMLISDFAKSGMTADEYCQENQVTGYQAELLRIFEKDALEKRENMNKRKGGK